MNILEELWYGNIDLGAQSLDKNSDYARALHKSANEWEKMSPQIQKIIGKLVDAQMEAAGIAERDAFVLGFRLAVQLMAASLGAPPLVSEWCEKSGKKDDIGLEDIKEATSF